MRAIATAVVFLLFSGSAFGAEYWQSDDLLECLVGKGVVAMRHGATVDEAIKAVLPVCQKVQDPPPPKGLDGADYTQFIYATAGQILQRAADVM